MRYPQGEGEDGYTCTHDGDCHLNVWAECLSLRKATATSSANGEVCAARAT